MDPTTESKLRDLWFLYHRVTRREREVVEALILNLSNKEIAARLNITERTVKFHMSNLIAKFETSGRLGVALNYLKAGM